MTDKITCPSCGHSFDVEEALSGKIEQKYQAAYESRAAELSSKFKSERDKLESDRKQFELKKEQENEIFAKKLKENLATEVEKIKLSTAAQFKEQYESLQKQHHEATIENRNLKAKEVALLQRENDLKTRTEELELQVKRELLQGQTEIEEKAKLRERENFQLKELEYQKQLNDQKKLIDEMKRKAEQVSMQLQGEVQELALEELLRQQYPFDRIDEVPKGIRGADCIQTVINNMQQPCGTIVYESKRTKSFSKEWISKLRQDQVSCKADIAILITEVYPTGMLSFGKLDGVWICNFSEIRSLSMAIRDSLIRIYEVRAADENKGEKMELLYHYLTGNEFVQNVKRIIETYDEMCNDLNKEKRAMYKIWETRQKQIDKVTKNISSLFGAIKGIAGKELDTLDVLELPLSTDGE